MQKPDVKQKLAALPALFNSYAKDKATELFSKGRYLPAIRAIGNAEKTMAAFRFKRTFYISEVLDETKSYITTIRANIGHSVDAKPLELMINFLVSDAKRAVESRQFALALRNYAYAAFLADSYPMVGGSSYSVDMMKAALHALNNKGLTNEEKKKAIIDSELIYHLKFLIGIEATYQNFLLKSFRKLAEG